jgi:hypothetical protein
MYFMFQLFPVEENNQNFIFIINFVVVLCGWFVYISLEIYFRTKMIFLTMHLLIWLFHSCEVKFI